MFRIACFVLALTKVDSQVFGGTWSASIELAFSPTTAAHLGNNLVMVFSGNGKGYNSGVGAGEWYQVINMDGSPSALTPNAIFTSTIQPMFCSGTAILNTGDVMLNGGNNAGAPQTVLFDDVNFELLNDLSAAMNIPRGYNSDVFTTDDRVFTIGGSFSGGSGGKNAEIFNVATGIWTRYDNLKGNTIGGQPNYPNGSNPDKQGIFRSDNHAWLAAWYNETSNKHMVFYLGPTQTMYSMDISVPGGIMKSMGNRATGYSMNAANVMFFPGKFAAFGGASAYGDWNSNVGLAASKTGIVIDLTGYIAGKSSAPVSTTSTMLAARTFANAVVMPGGCIFISGGQTKMAIFEDTYGVTWPEVFCPHKPAGSQYSSVPDSRIARNYHSWALLMPDARIMVGGGGLCYTSRGNSIQQCLIANGNWVHNDTQIFTPSYLIGTTRPTIRMQSPSSHGTMSLTGNIRVVASCDVALGGSCTAEIIKRNSVTHSTNNDQIRIPMYGTYIDGVTNGYRLWFNATSRPWVTSGYYMLFLINNGVPSMSIQLIVNR